MARLSRPPTARTRLTLTRASALRLQIKEAAITNRRRGVPAGGCGKQAMDGLRRRVRHGCLPRRGASPGRDADASEAGARIRGPTTSVGRRSIKKQAGAMPRQIVLSAADGRDLV